MSSFRRWNGSIVEMRGQARTGDTQRPWADSVFTEPRAVLGLLVGLRAAGGSNCCASGPAVKGPSGL